MPNQPQLSVVVPTYNRAPRPPSELPTATLEPSGLKASVLAHAGVWLIGWPAVLMVSGWVVSHR